MHMVGQAEMPQHHCAPPNRAVSSNVCAAGDTHATGERRVPAYMHVVANLDQVVQLDAVFDDCVLQGSAINAGIGADFNVITNPYSAKLFDLFPAAFVRSETKAIRTDYRARMDDAAFADAAIIGYGDPR